jgi:hypothetical protein
MFCFCSSLQALRDREEAVCHRYGKLSSTIFTRSFNSARGQEVSGYIDYGHRLAKDSNVEAWFERKKQLMPRPSDLRFYNWVTHLSTSNPTPHFQVSGMVVGL